MTGLYLALLAVASYFVGNVNWAIIISGAQKKDIRKMGSGNPGTLNMSRNLGLKFGLLTFFLDIMKGVVPTLAAYFIFRGQKFVGTEFLVSDLAIYLCGFCAVMGHIYPVVYKFKGGKGIASTIGVMIVCESVHGPGWASVIIMALVAAVIWIYFTEFGAMGSFIAITPPAISGSIRLILDYKDYDDVKTIAFKVITSVLILAICFFTWFAHRKNIERMLAGEEHPTSIKEMAVKAKAKKLAQKKADEERLNAEKTGVDSGTVAEEFASSEKTDDTKDSGRKKASKPPIIHR